MTSDVKTEKQIKECVDLLQKVLGEDLLAIYLYGSAVIGGLQKYSDIDLFVVSNRPTTKDEKKKLIDALLQISGIYMQSSKLPIELTMVVKSDVNPWRYPPRFDFQYGDWLRKQFESGVTEPWSIKIMPDLAILITKILLAHKILYGTHPEQLLNAVPYPDFIQATTMALNNLKQDLRNDTRNVLLTYARIWCTLVTDTIRSKPEAARWAIDRLPGDYKPVLERARSISLGQTNERWNDIKNILKPSVDFMEKQIQVLLTQLESTGYANRAIHLDKSS